MKKAYFKTFLLYVVLFIFLQTSVLAQSIALFDLVNLKIQGLGDIAAYEKTKHGRDINRTYLDFIQLNTILSNPTSREAKIFSALLELIKKRKQFKAFHPNAKQEVLTLDNRVFAILRGEGKERVLALHNVSKEKVEIRYDGNIFNIGAYEFFWKKIGPLAAKKRQRPE